MKIRKQAESRHYTANEWYIWIQKRRGSTC